MPLSSHGQILCVSVSKFPLFKKTIVNWNRAPLLSPGSMVLAVVHRLWSQTPSFFGPTHCLSHWLTPFQPHWTPCCPCTRQDTPHSALLHSLLSVPRNALPSRWLILSTSSLCLQKSFDHWAVHKTLYFKLKPKFHSSTTQHTPILFTLLFFFPWHLPPSKT